MAKRVRVLFVILLLSLASIAGAQDGIFADFVTNHGNFTCRLYYDKTPRAVGSFVGLADGTKPWLNLTNGEVPARPFFNGLTFHRVISGFVIQGGSPNGMGTDGPGYKFRDEFDPTLRHDRAGILSMANAGPNSNGSQFFVTLGATPHLDDKHTVFGEVTSGMDVVNAIGSVPVGPGDRPLQPVIMQSVTIRRVGSEAQAFNAAAQDVPVVGGADPRFYKSGASLFLAIPWALRSEYYFYNSANLIAWSGQRLGYVADQPPSGGLDITQVTGAATRHFYRVPHIQYPPLIEPASLAGGRFVINLGSGQLLTIAFNNSGGGAWSRNAPAGSGSLTTFTWVREFNVLLSGLACNFDAHPAIEIYPAFASATTGTYSGKIFETTGTRAISGTFQYTAPTSPSLFAVAAAPVVGSQEPVIQEAAASPSQKVRRAGRKRQRAR